MSGTRFTLDTNILVYAVDNRAGARQARNAAMIAADGMALLPCVANSGEAVRLALDAAVAVLGR